ncbi:MAG: hypothetical protein AB1556_13830 [Bacillota bacterium]
MLLEILLAFAGGWLVFIFWRVVNLFLARRIPGEQGLCKLYVLMGSQEEAAEGFLRRLMAWRNRLWPRLEVAVVDCGAGDDTGRIIRLLAGELDYPVLAGGSFRQERGPAAGGAAAPCYYYDARRQRGKDLINAPLFCFFKDLI